MLIASVLEQAQSYLQSKIVRDLVIGVSLIAVELDDSTIGVSYVLREDLASGCSIFPFGQEVIGESATSIAKWSIDGRDSLQKGIGHAVLGAASRGQNLEDREAPDRPFGIPLKDSDVVGMIGYIGPVVKLIGPRVKKLYIFDKGIWQYGGMGAADVLPIERQLDLLPTCDIVVLSGTTMINDSIDDLLKMCASTREVMMIGSSTPMFPEAFLDSKVTVLAGSWWKSQYKESIFKKISLACGIRELNAYSIKKTVRVRSNSVI